MKEDLVDIKQGLTSRKMLRELSFKKKELRRYNTPRVIPLAPQKTGKKGLSTADPNSENKSLNEKGKQNMGMQCGLPSN